MTYILLCYVASVVSDSVRPHRRQPTRLPRPWDSPGKNTGVGCHFLFQRMKVKSESEVAQSCPTLCDPVDGSLPGCPVPGILQARTLEWVAVSFSICLVQMKALGGSSSKEPDCQCRRYKRHGFDPWIRKILWRGHGSPVHYSCLENPMDRGAW